MNEPPLKADCSGKERERAAELLRIQRNQTQRTGKAELSRHPSRFRGRGPATTERDERQVDRAQGRAEEKNNRSQRRKPHLKQRKPKNTSLTKSCQTNLHEQRRRKAAEEDDSHARRRGGGVPEDGTEERNEEVVPGNARSKLPRERTQVFYPTKYTVSQKTNNPNKKKTQRAVGAET